MEGQGFEAGEADVVFASNVVHATRDVSSTLARAKRLLRRGGLLLVNEVTHATDFATLTFGLTRGWWLFEDAEARLPNCPLLGAGQWRRALAAGGFSHVNVIGVAGVPEESQPNAIVLGASDGRVEAQGAKRLEPGAEPLRPRGEQVAAAEKTAACAASVSLGVGVLEDRLIAHLRAVFAKVLRLRPERFGPDEAFEAFGIDSLVVLSINQQLEQVARPLPATLLFEQTTLRRLAGWLAQKQGAVWAAHLGVGAVEPQAPSSNTEPARAVAEEPAKTEAERLRERVAGLSDSEVDALLERLLADSSRP